MKKIILFALLLLTGCAAKDPEQRDYALGLFINQNSISVGTAVLSKDGENTECEFYEGFGETLEKALEDADSKTSGSLYTGHLLMCVIDRRAIDKTDELTKLFIEREELSKNVWVLAADDTKALEDTDIIQFVKRYYDRDNKKAADMNDIIKSLEQTGAAAVPYIDSSGSLTDKYILIRKDEMK